MLSFVLRRLLLVIPTVVLISGLTFVLSNLTPGDPAFAVASQLLAGVAPHHLVLRPAPRVARGRPGGVSPPGAAGGDPRFGPRCGAQPLYPLVDARGARQRLRDHRPSQGRQGIVGGGQACLSE